MDDTNPEKNIDRINKSLGARWSLALLLSLILVIVVFEHSDSNQTKVTENAAVPAPAGAPEVPQAIQMNPTDSPQDKFSEGQVWSLNSENDSKPASVTIVKIEETEQHKTVYHVSVGGALFKNPSQPNGIQENIPHLPLSEDAISKSVASLKGSGEALEGFDEGYSTWRKGYESGSAGVFSISIQEILVSMERIIAQQVSSKSAVTDETPATNQAAEAPETEKPLEDAIVDEKSP